MKRDLKKYICLSDKASTHVSSGSTYYGYEDSVMLHYLCIYPEGLGGGIRYLPSVYFIIDPESENNEDS